MNFRFLFTARLMPPYEVVRKFCRNPDARLDSGHVSWKSFEVDRRQYQIATEELCHAEGINLTEEIPAEVNDAYKWTIWQYQASHGVPYEEHLSLADIESSCKVRLDAAIKGNQDEETVQAHLAYVQASNNLDDFLEKYLVFE